MTEIEYSFFPIRNQNLYKLYKKLCASTWFPEEIDFSHDREDWDRLLNEKNDTIREKNINILNFIEMILAFFAQADGIVNENLIDNFQQDTSFIKEAGHFYRIQAANETIHSETYGLSIEILIQDEAKKEKMNNAINRYDSIKNIGKWVFKYMNKDIDVLERIVAFACVEGILFTSAFCAIYWIKKMNIFRGLCKANEFIARDENLHTEFGIQLYHHFVNNVVGGIKYKKLDNSKIKEIISSAVDVCSEFTIEALRVELIDMTKEDMIKYVKTVANSLSNSFASFNVYEGIKNPFDWMAVISLPNKTNFFEDAVSEYSKMSNTNGGNDDKENLLVEKEYF